MLKQYRLNNHIITEREQISEQVVTFDIDRNEDVVLFLSSNLGVYGTFYGEENLALVKETFPNAITREDYPGRYRVSSNNK